jgi:hypothetical protein
MSAYYKKADKKITNRKSLALGDEHIDSSVKVSTSC